MKKKEIEKALQNPPKPEYLYNRYDGRINKLEKIDKEKYIDVKTGVITDLNKYVLFGKVTYNIIDLIEEGDFVNGEKIDTILKITFSNGSREKMLFYNTDLSVEHELYYFKEHQIKTILTHEQYEQNCFEVEG